ncbi:hypothetical protein INS49_009159 [Diaporthe citri]|uniref:uncharacterized protein n=1 Tax=Diaporthe citri TaxID=83186 RepID=UPI001C80D7A7|nr:uncharacterized protein INS49_009159 [Diaporthe citri]KAG6364056.1 hypothetical protein INS49_009159 [Diaporthe citri]
MDRRGRPVVPLTQHANKEPEARASEENDEDESLLYSHGGRSQERKKSLSRKIWTAVLVVGSMACCFAGGFMVRDLTLPLVWNFDNYETLPADIQNLLLKNGDARMAFQKDTKTPTTRGEEASPPLWHQAPSAESDKYWDDNFMIKDMFLITADDMRRLGKDPDKHVSIPGDWGYGDRRYLTRFDHTHQLHCLDALRRVVFAGHNGINTSSAAEMNHFEHCVWSILDYLTCHVTYDTYNYVWMDDFAQPVPDHTSRRQCRDMKPLTDFYHRGSVHDDARIRYLVAQEDKGDFVHPIAADRKAFNDEVLAISGDPGVYGSEARARARKVKLDGAVAEYEATGTIPRVEKDAPAWP